MSGKKRSLRTLAAELRSERESDDPTGAGERDRQLTAFRQALKSFAGGGHPNRLQRIAIDGYVLSQRIVLDDVGTHAGALTYGALLSIPPLLLFSLSILGYFLAGSPSAQKAVIDAILSLVPPELTASATNVLQSQMSAAISGKLSLGFVGLIGLLWSASGFSARLRHALGQIFGTAKAGLLTGRAIGAVIGMLVVVSLLGLALLSGLEGWLTTAKPEGLVARVGLQVGLILGSFAFFIVFYRLLTPGKGPRLVDHAWGAALVVVGWEILIAVSGFFFARVISKSSALYGALGTLFGAIAFLYATVWLILLGAEVTASLWDARRAGRIPPASE